LIEEALKIDRLERDGQGSARIAVVRKSLVAEFYKKPDSRPEKAMSSTGTVGLLHRPQILARRPEGRFRPFRRKRVPNLRSLNGFIFGFGATGGKATGQI
jgi:hypothetical protein